MTEHSKPDRPLRIWTDGQCGLCTSSRGWCEMRDAGGRLQFTDFRTAEDRDLPAPREALESSMWVRDRDGRLLEGFQAWRRIMAELPGWRWLSAVSGLPPMRWLGPHVYRFIARNRHRLPAL